MNRTGENSAGFTLIELMIVIAIIGILAAIAIPNFISYRNKAFCTSAESDANRLVNEIGDYFAIPSNVSIDGGVGSLGNPALTGYNTATITTTDPNVNITVTVTDQSSRCPLEYQNAMQIAVDIDGWWSNSTPGVYTQLIRR